MQVLPAKMHQWYGLFFSSFCVKLEKRTRKLFQKEMYKNKNEADMHPESGW